MTADWREFQIIFVLRKYLLSSDKQVQMWIFIKGPKIAGFVWAPAVEPLCFVDGQRPKIFV